MTEACFAESERSLSGQPKQNDNQMVNEGLFFPIINLTCMYVDFICWTIKKSIEKCAGKVSTSAHRLAFDITIYYCPR